MGAKKCGASSEWRDGETRPDCVAAIRAQSDEPNQHYAERVARRKRVLNIAAWLAVLVVASFVMVQIATNTWSWEVSSINIVGAAIYASIPLLHRFGELLPPLTFIGTAYVSIFTICWFVGTGSGLQFYFLVAACLIVLQLGVDRIFLASFWLPSPAW